MIWSRTTTAHLPVTPEAVWSVLSDLSRWPEWEPAIATAQLDGPLAREATGSYAPSRGWSRALHERTAPPLRVTGHDEGRRLEITQPNPVGGMRVEWTLVPEGQGAQLTQTVEITGGLTPAVVLGVGADLDRGFLDAGVRLARLAGATPDPTLPRVVIAGGSGSLGRLLGARLFARGHDVRVLTRHRDPRLPFDQVIWDGRSVGDWADVLQSDDEAGVALVNLAGKLVDVRPTDANIAELRSSRVDSTRALVAASQGLGRPLVSWVQASTTAIWSDAHELRVTETTPVPEPGLPQMTGVARPWEDATEGANSEHLVLLRTSIVLDRQAPALQMLTRLTRAGLGGRVGSGYQWFSWIHHEDWLRVAVAALGLDPQVRIPDGPLIAAAPHPLRNADLMAALRRHLHRPAAPPTPAAMLHVGAVALRSDPALGLTGRHCTSTVLRDAGFDFVHPDLDSALTEIYG
jgi:uncharacterized protein (TIGR01777 family)